MQVFAKIIDCRNCKNTLCLEADDVKWRFSSLTKENVVIPGVTQYITTCPSCNFVNILAIQDLPPSVVKNAKNVDDGKKK